MALTIDSKKMMQDFLKNFEPELENAVDKWKQDVLKFSSDLINKLGVPKADAQVVLDLAGRTITVFFKANGVLLADIYGTGSKLVEDKYLPETFSDYWNNRGAMPSQVNPSRKTHAIEGRPEGLYVNIFGNKRTSKGRVEGQNIEGGGVQPIEPNKELLDKYFGTAIQIADKFFKTIYLKNALENTIRGMDLSIYVNEVK